MSSSRIRLIIGLMLLTIGSLFMTQVYWFKKSFDLEESQLDEKINISLRQVAHQLLKGSGDYISRIPPIEKLSSNEFYIPTHCYFSIKQLDSLLAHEFEKRKLNLEYDYGMVAPETKEILLGNSVFNSVLSSDSILFENACLDRKDQKKAFDFKIRVNNKTTFLLGSMGIWMYSSVSLLVVLLVFTLVVLFIFSGKKLNALKHDFINNMTHELKTPIANIAVASDAIRNREMDDEKKAKYADIIHKENNRLHSLVDRVLQISTIEKGSDSFSMELVDVNHTIATVTNSFEALIQEKNGRLTTQLISENASVFAYKIHLSNVVYNLIENAIKYSKNEPEISIVTAIENGMFKLEISDKGIGMSSDSQQKVFEKFYRVEGGNLHTTRGYGLGLSYVKMVVEYHKGLIKLNSALGKGSTFKILLPMPG